MTKETKQNAAPRLSLQDFKIKAIDGKKEIEKLSGGVKAPVAASCHMISVDPSASSANTFD